MAFGNLTPAQVRAIAGAADDGTLVDTRRDVADALIRAGLAEPVTGNPYRANRYADTTQRVYGVRTGTRLNAAGLAVRSAGATRGPAYRAQGQTHRIACTHDNVAQCHADCDEAGYYHTHRLYRLVDRSGSPTDDGPWSTRAAALDYRDTYLAGGPR